MKNYSKWKDNQVVELFRFIEKGKANNICLTKLFEEFAEKTGRMPNSVRNYYYNELENLLQNNNRAKKLGIDVNLHQKNDQKEFSEKETEKLVVDILKQTSKGVSVRKACLTLANGDINLMVRYQNKFRSVVVKDKELYDRCIQNLNLSNVKPLKRTLPSNVIEFKDNRHLLSESDINSLFLGLVKLVKKQAGEEAEKQLKAQSERSNYLLRKTLVELSEKEIEIKNLRKNFKILSDNNEKLTEDLKTMRGKNAELVAQFTKMKNLKNFSFQKNTKKEKAE